MDSKKPAGNPKSNGALPHKAASPDWADGLKKLYDSVVDEPLPDTFKDLLDKLDEGSGESSEGGEQA